MSLTLTYKTGPFTTDNYQELRQVIDFLDTGRLGSYETWLSLTKALKALKHREGLSLLSGRCQQELETSSDVVKSLHIYKALICQQSKLKVKKLTLPTLTPTLLALLDELNYEYPIPLELAINLPNIQVPKLDETLTSLLQPGVCIAGGLPMVQSCLGLKHTENSDVDTWVFGTTEEDRKMTYANLIKHLFGLGYAVAGSKGDSVLTFSLAGYPRNIQVILTSCQTALEVINSFDIDASRAFFQGETEASLGGLYTYSVGKCYALAETLQAWSSREIKKATVYNNLRFGKLEKRGFTISVDYEPPSEQEIEKCLHLVYTHQTKDTPDRVAYMMKKILGVDEIFQTADQVFEGFDCKPIYQINTDYQSIGLKLVPVPHRNLVIKAIPNKLTDLSGSVDKSQKALARRSRYLLRMTSIPEGLRQVAEEIKATTGRDIFFAKNTFYCNAELGVSLQEEVEQEIHLSYQGYICCGQRGDELVMPIMMIRPSV